MELAEKGLIGALIVKDHSRLGRNRLIVGQLLEEGFDSLGVRYIAIMDNIDTAKGISDLVPMQDLFNEWHAKNTSQKVRNVFKSKGMSGAPLTTNPPYGYLKDPENKNGWIVDEEAAKVVRYIFGLRSEGYGYCSIVKILNEKEIKSPSAYRYEKGIVKNEKLRDVLWKAYAIEDMLRDEVYLGNMVRGKTHSAMHKGEKRHPVPREEWIVVPGMHKPIVSKELFDAVQAVNEKRAQEHKIGKSKRKSET